MDVEQMISELQTALDSGENTALALLARKAVVEHADQAFGYYFLAESNIIKEKYQNAELCLAKAIELDDENAAYWLRLASIKETQNSNEDARLIYSKILDFDENNAQALLGLAQYNLLHAKDPENALGYLDQAIEQEDQNSSLFFLRAHAHQEVGNYESALEDADSGLELEKTEQGLILKINALGELEGQVEALTATYKELIELVPDGRAHQITFANYLIGEDLFAEALTQLEAILAKSEDYNGPVQGLRGLALLGQEKYQEAIENFNLMAEKDVEDEEIYIQRAEAYIGLGNNDAAIADLQKAASMLPETNALVVLNREADLYLSMGDWQKAKAIYSKLSKSDLYTAEGYFGLGRSLQAEGEMSAAFEALQKAQKLRHKQAKSYLREHFGDLLGKKEEAIINKYAAQTAKNANSASLKPFFGKYCKFDPAKNDVGGNLPADVVKKLLAGISEIGIIMTEKGLVILNPIEKKPQRAIYTIEEDDEDGVMIEIIPLDGSDTYLAQLEFDGAGMTFEPQIRKANAIGLSAIDATKLAGSDKTVIKKYLSKADLEFLGEAATTFNSAVFG